MVQNFLRRFCTFGGIARKGWLDSYKDLALSAPNHSRIQVELEHHFQCYNEYKYQMPPADMCHHQVIYIQHNTLK